MTTDVRFTTHPSARPLLPQAPAAPVMPAGQPLGYPAASDDAQGLANSLDAIQRNPPRTTPALGEDLLAEALLRYAQRNRAQGQATGLPAQDSGGGGYGAGLAPPGAPPGWSSTDSGGVFHGPSTAPIGGWMGGAPPLDGHASLDIPPPSAGGGYGAGWAGGPQRRTTFFGD